MRTSARFLLALLLGLSGSCLPAHAVSEADSVRASLLIMSPGEAVYSALGHAALRLQSPTYGLDFCFTYGMDMRPGSQFKFLDGHAPAGYLTAPSHLYLQEYEAEGRSVTAYELNLTLEEKRRLWKYLDQKVARGLCDHYDYLHNGCAQVCLRAINAALSHCSLDFHLATGDPLLTSTRRELAHAAMGRAPWADIFWLTITGSEIDEQVPLESRIVVPTDLLRALQHAMFTDSAGASRPVLLGPSRPTPNPSRQGGERLARGGLITPELIAMLIALLVLVAGITSKPHNLTERVIDALLLTIYAFFALFMTWLVVCSDLVASSWNQLLLAYNPLPLLVWAYYRFLRPGPVPTKLLLAAAIALLVIVLLNMEPIGHFPTAHIIFLAGLILRLLSKTIHIQSLFIKLFHKA